MINLMGNDENIIKCVGVNENNLPHQQFILLFQQECQQLGFILMMNANNRFAAAVVIKR